LEHGKIKFSLILATVGRVEELEKFLQHLDLQTYRSFELIIVDQNPDGILDSLIRQYQGMFPLLHLRWEKGLSRARNVGLQRVSGDIVAFPDDDCWYAPDTLEWIARKFSQDQRLDGITGRGVDEERPGDFLFFSRRNEWVNQKNVFRCGTSISIFLRTSVLQTVGPFDESLGTGSGDGKHAAEECDYLIRTLESGFRIYYCVDLCVLHPYPVPTYDRGFIKKAFGYSVGFGYVLRKHNYPISFVVNSWLRALGGAAISLATFNLAKSRYHFATLKGRVLGWLG
jgi:glycosyltransferase involved in cell wall biosynthesis